MFYYFRLVKLCLLILLSLFISGCINAPSKVLPEKEIIIKIKSDRDLGVIAESKDTTYYFTNEKTKVNLAIYANFLKDFKNDINSIEVSFLQSNTDDSVYVTYINYVPEEKIKNKLELFNKYKDRSKVSNGLVTVGFNTEGKFITQQNILSEDDMLDSPIEVNVNQVSKSIPNNNVFNEISAVAILPIFVPFMMIGCVVGPC
ncbi:hypothetical protein GCM10023211_05680 [Orbus sasakiae]|uniref:Lipoprotein n=1 Tax=Orbus sasakiae TaxID=1078475 RepID=A0ABP9N615_9GAMM